MIHGTLDILEEIMLLEHDERFAEAFAFLRQLRRGPVPEPGRCEITPGTTWASIIANEGRRPHSAPIEYHRRHADVHLCLAGEEDILWQPSLKGLSANGAFDEEKDFGLLTGNLTERVRLGGGRFVILHPGEPHAPLIGSGLITKVCVKVRMVPAARMGII